MLSIKYISKKLAIAFFICAAIILLVPVSAVAATQSQEPVGEIIVRYRNDVSPGEMFILGLSHGTTNIMTVGNIKVQEVEITDGSSVNEKLKELKKDPSVEYAEPNYRREALLTTPNDAYYSSYQWNMPITRADYAWDITRGNTATKIAIIDTGVSLTHPDLSAKIIAGYDFVDNDSSPMDEQGHGTHVAGIAAAISNNGVGVAGADQLEPLRGAPPGALRSLVAEARVEQVLGRLPVPGQPHGLCHRAHPVEQHRAGPVVVHDGEPEPGVQGGQAGLVRISLPWEAPLTPQT